MVRIMIWTQATSHKSHKSDALHTTTEYFTFGKV